MKKSNLIIALNMMFLAIFFIGCNKDDDNTMVKNYEEVVAVANRGGKSVSFIDAKSNAVIKTLTIEGAEPMYLVYVPMNDKLYVGDRATKKVHIINPQTKALENSIEVGNGVFHMWADGKGKQLWVSNDVDNTVSVIDLKKNTVVHTINIGMKPHDVFLSKDATKAYVSVINSDKSMPDKIFMYSTSDYTKKREVNVGKDPHLFHLANSNKLYVPCQSGQVYILNPDDLSVISNNPFEGAHGIFSSPDEKTIFVTNITGGQLYSIDASNGTENGTALASLSKVPHNITVNEAGGKMFVTHSGATAELVSVYDIKTAKLSGITSVKTGTNPFGITYYKRELK